MKTHSRSAAAAGASVCHAAVAHPPRSAKSARPNTTTPLASPRGPYSVGQSTPPKLSPARHHDARASSPNYFGLVVDSSNDTRESMGLARDNWSPASSSVKSFAAALPKQLPLEPNTEFEAFRRQADLNSFALPALPQKKFASARARPPKLPTLASDVSSATNAAATCTKMDVDNDTQADGSADGNLRPPPVPTQITSMRMSRSPQNMDSPRRLPTVSDPNEGRLSLAIDAPRPSSPCAVETGPRAITLPPKLDGGGPSMISDTCLKELMESIADDQLLLLDIRSLQSFAQSRIRGALNLCIPTTLLKRPNFNIEKLQQTFQGGAASDKFADWRLMSWIIVYDAHGWESREAVTAQNMIKKFTNEGFKGETAILRGGFSVFHKSYPHLVDNGSTTPAAAHGGRNGRGNGGLAPVIGGVNLPASTSEVDPFFSNIRQNVDLADGVGQMEVTRPSGLDSPLLPQWLREAASKNDRGRRVADKFLRIELDEQARMRSAYAAFQPGAQGRSGIQLSGVEKGSKNRYKDILPFEHARVRLQSKPAGSCDYVNASHLGASRCHKRYIASQGPLPATFEDFWSVVWEQDVRVIVMLTAETEGGQLKCHPYWKAREFGPIRLRPLSEKRASLDMDKNRGDTCAACSAAEFGRKRANTTTTLEAAATPGCASCQGQGQGQGPGQSEAPYVVIRKFALAHTAHPFAPMREITHLHFPAWPDFGTPAKASHLLALVELANLMHRAARPVETTTLVSDDYVPASWYDEPENEAQPRPMMVHCSAGCGRTGTFCAVDSVIDMLKRQRQAKLAAARDGCGGMDADDDAISPRTSSVVHGPSPGKGPGPGTAGLDAAWVRDETEDLIQATVQDFREQRLSMVQSLRQYVLCYETIVEWMHRVNERAAGGRLRSGSLQQPRRNKQRNKGYE
ncbi:hypothetical protein CDD80_2361 [Ophiocordyceps camponoti-rufipedis]|uniref:protein-tyrosine-phosphatase n=1 Tax=Ophiocordyceps camponoti-rufipedis TaxID=2004952 RepID=A0A2C5XKG0_9HYPO|nr:hypothetical protein CDD80_2361 [Ophiocordyceps camponoti-rufipedis]